MGHRCCSKQKVKRGLWSPEEDEKLIKYITTHGHGSWSSVPKFSGLQRCGKSCRLRWINYLRPDLKKGSFSDQEERIIIDVHRILGNRWAQIAKHLPGRTDNEVKNFWNSCIKKKLIAQGFDPDTHNLLTYSSKPKTTPNIHDKTTSPFSIDHLKRRSNTTTTTSSSVITSVYNSPHFYISNPREINVSNIMMPPNFCELQNPNTNMVQDVVQSHPNTSLCELFSNQIQAPSQNPLCFEDFEEDCLKDIGSFQLVKKGAKHELPKSQSDLEEKTSTDNEIVNCVNDLDSTFESFNFDLDFNTILDSSLLSCGLMY